MSETNQTTRGFRRITRLGQPVKLRLFGFFLVVTCGGALLAWVTRSTWRQLDRLQREHAAVKSESFYLGVTLRSAIRSLNSKLLQFGLSKENSARDSFEKESSALQGWIDTNRVHLAEVADLRLLRTISLRRDLQVMEQAEGAYHKYLIRTAKLLEPAPPPADLDSFEEVYAEVQSSSRELLQLCDQLVTVQAEGFNDFLSETQRTLLAHQRLLELSSALILGMAGTLALMVYRGMIAPLRRGLSESKTIIERQEKLASLGVLASGVAHEIRNPLTAIKFRLFSLKSALPALADNEDARMIADEINRLERIVKDFLRFARPSEPQLEEMPAEQALRDVRDFLKGQLERGGIELRCETGEGGWVRADSQQLKQVLLNLIQNAAEAIGRDGTITLRLRREVAELNGKSGRVVTLAVSDTGKGIAPDIEARLFDPFFSTKEGGTGLGLAIAARIVEKHGGILRYETELNRGTTFEVLLPTIESDATKTTPDRRRREHRLSAAKSP